MSDPLIQVQFQPSGRRVELPAGASLLEAAHQAGIDLNASCGGSGSCGQCQIILLKGKVSAPSSDEYALLGAEGIERGRRLACSTSLVGDSAVEIPPESLSSGQRLSLEHTLPLPETLLSDPVVRTFNLVLHPPTIADVRSDLTRISDAFREQYAVPAVNIHLDVLRTLPGALRQNNWQVSAYLRGDQFIGLAAPGLPAIGYCVDLGTTKIAAMLVDLQSGQVLATRGAPNPQLGHGDDIISRINYALRNPEGADILAEKAQSAINTLLTELITQARVLRSQVVEGCIVGNSAMIHLLLKLPVRQLAFAPHVSAAATALEVRAVDLHLEMAPGALVYFPPGIGGFIGSDHTAMLLACDLDQADRVSLGIDIGTNSEIVIRVPGRGLLGSASCASGPAFEGAHIREGMRAGAGAIEQVHITPHGLDMLIIQNETPVGICGSGMVDVIAELLRCELITRQGTLLNRHEDIRSGKNGSEFVLVPAEKSGTGRDIVIDQKDINEIQLAKGAIHAGIRALLAATGTTPDAVEDVIIAGAFGAYLNIRRATAIGLFPKMPKARFQQVGNAALAGAHRLLVSRQMRQRADAIQGQVQYLELTGYPNFNRMFATSMLFPNAEELL